VKLVLLFVKLHLKVQYLRVLLYFLKDGFLYNISEKRLRVHQNNKNGREDNMTRLFMWTFLYIHLFR
jgi:hypothetical protein